MIALVADGATGLVQSNARSNSGCNSGSNADSNSGRSVCKPLLLKELQRITDDWHAASNAARIAQHDQQIARRRLQQMFHVERQISLCKSRQQSQLSYYDLVSWRLPAPVEYRWVVALQQHRDQQYEQQLRKEFQRLRDICGWRLNAFNRMLRHRLTVKECDLSTPWPVDYSGSVANALGQQQRRRRKRSAAAQAAAVLRRAAHSFALPQGGWRATSLARGDLTARLKRC